VLLIAPRVNRNTYAARNARWRAKHRGEYKRRPARADALEASENASLNAGNTLMSNTKTKKGKTPKTRVRQPLTSLGGLIAEAAKVYRLMRTGKLDHEQGRSLVWVLSQIRPMLEAQMLERIEAKLDAMAAAAPQPRTINGHTSSNLPALAAH
jgi:hypothetical protein